MNAQEQFEKVAAICQHLKDERGENGTHTPNEVVSVTTAYLLACDRTGRTHHLEDSPHNVSTFAPDAIRDAQGYAHELVWDIIGDADTRTNDARYTAAWDVWGILLPQWEDGPSMA